MGAPGGQPPGKPKGLHWDELGPVHLRADIPPLRIDGVTAHWPHMADHMRGEFLRVIDMRNDDIVADFQYAQSSEVVADPHVPEGMAHIMFGLRSSSHVLIIDPAGDRCRLAGGAWQPVPQMQSLVDTALADMQPTAAPEYFVYSPDGRVRIDYYEEERRNNEWIPYGQIRDLETDTVVLRHSNIISDGHHEWVKPGRVDFHIRNSPYYDDLLVEFDLDAQTVKLHDSGPRPIAQANRLIESWLNKRDRKIDMFNPLGTADQTNRTRTSYNWRYALICGAIAALFYLALFYFGGLI